MSSTRKSKDSSVFHQNRYASSPEFERGLLGNLVAKRCAVLESPEDRKLIWFVQHLSHCAGGIGAVASAIINQNRGKIQTRQMVAMKLKRGTICSADQVKKIRDDLYFEEFQRESFMLKGEVWRQGGPGLAVKRECSELEFANAQRLPTSYNADKFFDLCQVQADANLETYLNEICLDPATRLEHGPWYFHELIDSIREYQAAYIKSRSVAFVTELGQKIEDALDYASFSHGLTLIEGEARRGKSFAGRLWCEKHPGAARFVEVPPSNDDAGFYRAIARGLGLGNFLQYKACELRERVESVLLSGDLVLVLDEAQRLWPQRNLRYGYPSRIDWVMSMSNAGVPIAMIATPQFIVIQKAVERNGWNSAQLTGRIMRYEPLPSDLSQNDLMAVAKSVLPESDNKVLSVLADYALISARYLAAIETISKSARYIAMKDGRDMTTAADIKRAMQESVIPADSKLQAALARGKNNIRGKIPLPKIEAGKSDLSGQNFPRRNEAPALDNTRRDNVPLIEA